MRSQKPQKGNPHKLTFYQHIFPKQSIVRFTNSNGYVQVRQTQGTRNQDLYLKPKNPFFCAQRVWDQKTESIMMRDIEARYQKIADQIVANSIRSLDTTMSVAVTDMYLLWSLRHQYSLRPNQDVTMNGVKPERKLSIDQQEILEANGYIFINPECALPGRFITGINIFRQFDMERILMHGKYWGIVRSSNGEFLVPDNFCEYSVVPLTPTICLVEGVKDQTIGYEQVASINREAIKNSHQYIFGRDLKKCPALK